MLMLLPLSFCFLVIGNMCVEYNSNNNTNNLCVRMSNVSSCSSCFPYSYYFPSCQPIWYSSLERFFFSFLCLCFIIIYKIAGIKKCLLIWKSIFKEIPRLSYSYFTCSLFFLFSNIHFNVPSFWHHKFLLM